MPKPESDTPASSFEALTARLPRRFAQLTGIYGILGGVLTLIGWAIPLPRLTDWAGKGISMFPNAALCGILCGLTLLLGRPGGRGILLARIFATLSALIGGLTFFEHLTGINVGLDEMLFKGTWGQAASTAPNRIGVPASTSYLSLGIALLLSTGGLRWRRAASVLAVLPLAIASLSLVGYWFGANQLFGIARYTGIAWQTANIIALLSLGLIAALPEYGLMALLRRDDPGGVVARRLVVPITAIPLLLGWLRIVGQNAGLYDPAFGTALRTLVEAGLLLALLYWTATSIGSHAIAAKETAAALRTSDERFSRFMQYLPGLAWIKDRAGRYVYANDAALKAFRQTRETLIGNTDHDFLPAATAKQFSENDRLALASPSGVQIIETLEHEDGTIHSSVVSKFPIPGHDGLVGGIAIDITDRMRAEEALREAHRRKDEFLATLAHELRNPLAPIRFAVQLFKDKAPADEELDWALDVIERQIQQMVRLLEDLLDVSRISYGKLTLRKERVSLRSVIDRAVETSTPLIEKGGQHLAVHLPPDDIMLDADPVRLAQVFSNLLNNAAKYTRPGSHIRIDAAANDGSVAVTVADDGVGISPEMLPRIFEMFSQAGRSSDTSQGGLGIGLSLVQGLVQLHGGSVEAQSSGRDKGCAFIVRLPTSTAEAAAAASPADDAAIAPLVARQRFLIADDLRDSADSLSMFFRSRGHDVRTAYDGAQALEIAMEWKPRIVLLDIGMPRLSGHEVCRRIRDESWGRTAFIVAITGWGQESDRRLTAEAGFDHHLVKPADATKLEKLLECITARR